MAEKLRREKIVFPFFSSFEASFIFLFSFFLGMITKKLDEAASHCLHVRDSFSIDETNRILNLCKSNKITFNTLLQAAWSLLLSLYSRQDTVVFGSTTSGRSIASINDIEKMVGLMINTLPVKVNINPQSIIHDWLDQIQSRHIQSVEFEYSHLIDVQSVSAVPKGTALFDSLLIYENFPQESSEAQEKLITDAQGKELTSFPLTIIAQVVDQKMEINVSYNPTKVATEAIQPILDSFKFAIPQLLNDIEKPLSEFSFLVPSQSTQIAAWNSSFTEYTFSCIHEQIRHQVIIFLN